MSIIRTIGTSALVAALALSVAGCNRTSDVTRTVTTVETSRFANTEICNTAAWIRDRAPAGVCSSESVVDDNMSLRRLHEELERSGR